MFTIPYNDTDHTVRLRLLPDGYLTAHDSSHILAIAQTHFLSVTDELDYDLLHSEEHRHTLAMMLSLVCVSETLRAEDWLALDRTHTEPIFRAVWELIERETAEMNEIAEFYDDGETPTRFYSFRNGIDAMIWRMAHATQSISEAGAAWHAHSRLAVERYLILKNLMGTKNEEEDDDDE